MSGVRVLVGTHKGAFILTSNEKRCLLLERGLCFDPEVKRSGMAVVGSRDEVPF